MKLEGERLAVGELHVMDVRLAGELELLALDDLLVRLLNERLQRFLANGIAELLAHHCRRGLSRAEAR
jgi:hypothetical protein